MSTIQNYYAQAELALAAYGDLPIGTLKIADLTKDTVGMATDQAALFAATYEVLAQQQATGSGLAI